MENSFFGKDDFRKCVRELVMPLKEYYFIRRKCTEFYVNDDASVYSRWSPFEGVSVETTIIPTEDGHIRTHIIEADREYIAYDCGFSLWEEDGDVLGNGEKVLIKTFPNLNLYDPRPLNIKAIKYRIPIGKTKIETKVIYPE